MLKYTDTQVVFREFPGEVTLAINISGCPNHCPGCHSPELQQDIGEPLNWDTLKDLIEKNPGVTCIGFMGGDNDPMMVKYLAYQIRSHLDMRVGWYTGVGNALTMREMGMMRLIFKASSNTVDDRYTLFRAFCLSSGPCVLKCPPKLIPREGTNSSKRLIVKMEAIALFIRFISSYIA